MVPKFLRNDYPLEKHYLLIPRFALSVIGFYPETQWNLRIKTWAIFNILVLGYSIYAEFLHGVHYISTDFLEAMDAFCPMATSIMSFIKIFFIWWYRDQYKRVIEDIRRLTEAQSSIWKQKMKRTYFTIATRLTALVLFFSICTGIAYNIRPILTNIVLYVNGESIVYETAFKMIFPELLLSMPLYPITYILVCWYGYITALSFVGCDGFFLGFSFYLSTLFKALEKDLTDILEVESGRRHDLAEKEIYSALTEIIERHNEIADLSIKLSSIMQEITLCHFITSSLIIGISVVDFLLFAGGYGSIVYIVYTCAVLTEIFLYCLGGTVLMEASQELAIKAYTSNWYDHSVKIQKLVLLIILRSQRTIVIDVPFFSPSFPTLTSILRFTGSLITLVKSVI